MVTQNILNSKVTYEMTRAEIEAILKKHLAALDGSVTWDVQSNGKVRGASITVLRREIQGDIIAG